MAVITDPLALATKGIIKTGGTTDPLGVATFGVIVVSGGATPTPLLVARRTPLLTYIGRQRR